jgi:hypothetical protein
MGMEATPAFSRVAGKPKLFNFSFIALNRPSSLFDDTQNIQSIVSFSSYLQTASFRTQHALGLYATPTYGNQPFFAHRPPAEGKFHHSATHKQEAESARTGTII